MHHRRIYWLAGVVLTCCLAIFGCLNGGLDLNVRFDRLQGLKKGAPVYFKANQIGRVQQVTAGADHRFDLAVIIQEEFKALATENVRFFIAPGQQDATAKVLHMMVLQQGGQPLEDGATVEGSSAAHAMIDQLLHGIHAQVQSFRKQVSDFSRQIEAMSDSEALHQFEQQLKDLAAAMQSSGEDMRNRIRHELLPELRQQFEQLRKRLEENGRGQDAAPLDEYLHELENA